MGKKGDGGRREERGEQGRERLGGGTIRGGEGDGKKEGEIGR